MPDEWQVNGIVEKDNQNDSKNEIFEAILSDSYGSRVLTRIISTEKQHSIDTKEDYINLSKEELEKLLDRETDYLQEIGYYESIKGSIKNIRDYPFIKTLY